MIFDFIELNLRLLWPFVEFISHSYGWVTLVLRSCPTVEDMLTASDPSIAALMLSSWDKFSRHLVGDDVGAGAGSVGIAVAVELAPSRGQHETDAVEAALDAAEDFARRFRAAVVTALRRIDPSIFVVHSTWTCNDMKVNLTVDSSIFPSLSTAHGRNGRRAR